MQVLDNGALAYLCPNVYDPFLYDDAYEACILKGQLVYLTEDDNYVDNQKIKLSKGMCFVSGGAFRYTTKDRYVKTVRKVQIAEF